MAFSNTFLHRVEWVTKFQERLNKPQNWNQICNVEYTDLYTLTNPYMSTVPNTASHTRGTAFTYTTLAFTTDTHTISTSAIWATAMDRADYAQCGFLKQMDLAELAAVRIGECLEAAMLASYSSMTTFDNATLTGGAAGNITVSESNVDNIIRKLKQKITEANGLELANRNGIFIVWRPEDFEKLEAFCMANGFNTADAALKNGISIGFTYGGVEHYVSNSHTANHLIAGVKKALHLGICKSTFGKLTVVENPYADTGVISGVGLDSRVDYAYKVWNNVSTVLYDVRVA